MANTIVDRYRLELQGDQQVRQKVKQTEDQFDRSFNAAERSTGRASRGLKNVQVQAGKTRGSSMALRNGLFELGNSLAVTGGRAGIMANQLAEAGARMIGGGGLTIAIGALSAAMLAIGPVINALTGKTQKFKEEIKDTSKELSEMSFKLRNEELRLSLGLGGLEGAAKDIRLQEKRIEEQRKLVKDIKSLLDSAPGGLAGRRGSIVDVDPATAMLAETLGGTINEDVLRKEERRLKLLEKRLRLIKERERQERQGERRRRTLPEGEAPMPGFAAAFDRAGPAGLQETETERLERLGQGLTFGGAARDQRQLARAMERRQELITGIRERNEARRTKIMRDAAERRKDIARREAEAMQLQQRKIGTAMNVANSAIMTGVGVLEDLAAGAEVSMAQVAKSFLSSTGKRILAQGIADISQGVSRALSSYGLDATAEGLITWGGTEVGIGGAMIGGSLIVPPGQSGAGQGAADTGNDAQGGGFGGGGFGAGGGGFGRGGGGGGGSNQPVIININGSMTNQETMAAVRRGMRESVERGF